MAQDLQNIESIFDFFYLDNIKIKSFYAQLNGLGSLNTLKNTSQVGDTRKLEATVGVPAVTGGKMGSDHTASTSTESSYDGIPTMPREMINRLDQLKFIHRELSPDVLGNLVLLKGKLGVIDVGVTKDMISPALTLYTNELFKNKQNANLANQIKKHKKEIVDAVKAIPFSLEARLLIETGDFNDEGTKLANEVWMTLNREEMINNPHDLNFKHGQFLAGEWYTLGILDALPFDNFTYDTDKNEIRSGVEQMLNGMKDLIGRPQTAFGLTPIAIFRVLKPTMAINQSESESDS